MVLPSVPSNKFMYETDGTGVWYSNVTLPVGQHLTQDQIVRMNSYWSVTGGHDYATYTNDRVYYYLHFPEPRNITHIACATTGSRTLYVDTSTDAHNIQTATWTAQTAPTMLQLPVAERTWRTPTAVNWTGVRAIRFSYVMYTANTGRYFLCHLYGSRAQTGRLALWHPTLDQELLTNDMQWTEEKFGSITYRTFRVRNLSTSTAVSPTVTTDSQTDPWVPPVSGYMRFSYQGGGYESAIVLPSIAAGATSDVVSMQFRAPSIVNIASMSTRVIVTPASWA